MPNIHIPGTSASVTHTGALIGQAIDWRAAREALGYTQEGLAAVCGITDRITVYRWETGATAPSRAALMSLYAHLRQRSRRLARAARPFSLVEIMLALVVIGIGLSAVMVLPVIATRASRDAVAYSHAADTGQWVAEYLSNDAALVAGLPAGPVLMPDTSRPPAETPAVWQSVASQPNLWRGVGAANGVYRYYATRQRGAVNTVMRCWREPHVVTWPDGTQMNSTQVTVELTWPATSPTQDRERATFTAMAAE